MSKYDDPEADAINPDDLSELPGPITRKPRKPKKRLPVTKERRQRPVGRPTTMTTVVVDEFLFRMTHGMSLNKICAMEDMPSTTTIMRWIAENEEFAKQYAAARTALADYLADETLDIADDARNDYMLKFNRDGSDYEVFNPEHVARSKLRIEQRKWYVSVLNPHKYNPKVDLNHGVQPDNPLGQLIAQINGTGVKPASQRSPDEISQYAAIEGEFEEVEDK